ncbi:DNA cytosine methyltransferase [Mycobacteroides abscessus]|uniref:DNA cytosine methyltransferase n=1 Tax=Mycobacteroides abscessus TaxID=36809 RepID=UPI001F162B84|nr:DNA cytosine methyltransferase [Mycobacteroides abscessus]MDO3110050.1 DNA cytosine methyltransferase [Mycobacteroides abscessus subsp. abscessus]
MLAPRIGSLFSGAGGLDLAVEHVTGGRTVWHCEADPDASKVLAAHWPDVPNLGDITAVDWSAVEPVDVLCGGFPCQDVSAAGRRAGLAGGTRSGLWAEMARAIEALRPALVVIENVEGLLTADGEPWPPEVIAADDERSRWNRICALIDSKIERAKREGWWHGQYRTRKKFEAARASRLRKRAVARFKSVHRRLVQRAIAVVVGTLAELGYDTQWDLVSAAQVGAPHRRKRIFIVAYPESGSRPHEQKRGDAQGFDVVAESGPSNRDCARGTAAGVQQLGRSARELAAVDLLPTPSVADGTGGHLSRSGARSDELLLPGVAKAYAEGALLPTPTSRDHKGVANPPGRVRDGRVRTAGDNMLPDAIADLLPTPAASDATGGGQVPDKREGHSRQLIDYALLNGTPHWGKYEPAIRRWEAITRDAPSPTEPGAKGNPRLAARFSEWMQGWPLGWVTAVPITRSAMLRIIGNGVVPQQAVAALCWLLSVCEVAA